MTNAGWVRGLAESLVADRNRSADLEQETWLAVLSRGTEGIRDLKSWLRKVMLNKARQEARGRARRDKREQAVAREEGLASTAELASQAEMQQRVVQAVLDLDDPYRSTLLLHFFHGLSSAQIARDSAVSASTVRNQLRRGLATLRERFDRELGSERSRRESLGVLLALPRRGSGVRPGGHVRMISLAAKTWLPLSIGALGLVLATGLWWPKGAPKADPTVISSRLDRRTSADREHSAATATAGETVTRDGPADATSQRVSVPATRDMPAPEQSIDVAPRTALAGVVVNTAGGPIQGAEVSVAPRRDLPMPLIVETDADGEFELPLTDGDIPDRLVAFHPEYRAAVHTLLEEDVFGPGLQRIVLQAGASLCIAVVDERGLPVPDARMRAYLETGSSSDGIFVGSEEEFVALDRFLFVEGHEARMGHTDTNGYACVSGLSAGSYTVSVHAEGYLPGHRDGEVEVRDEERIDLEAMVLEHGWRATGRVLSPEGAPVEGARVMGFFALTYQETRSDDSGRYVLGDFPARPVTGEVLIQHPDYAVLLVEVVLERETHLDFVLEDRSLSVELLDPTGVPVAKEIEVELSASPESLLFRDPLRFTMSPVEGLIEFSPLDSPIHLIRFIYEDCAPATLDLSRSWSGMRKTTVLFQSGSSHLVIQVLDREGRRITGEARIVLHGEEITKGGLSLPSVRSAPVTSEASDGLYRIPLSELDPEQKTWSVVVEVAGYLRSDPVLVKPAGAPLLTNPLTVWLASDEDR